MAWREEQFATLCSHFADYCDEFNFVSIIFIITNHSGRIWFLHPVP